MSATPPTSFTVSAAIVVAALLAAGVALIYLGHSDAGTGLVGTATGIVVGGGGVHIANRNGSG